MGAEYCNHSKMYKLEDGESGISERELIKNEVIQNRIYTIHGVQVILDED